MSETTEAPAPAEIEAPATIAETPEVAPETAPPQDPPSAEGATESEPAPGDEPWRKTRIEQMARQKNDAIRERDLARREAEALRAQVEEFRAGRDPDAAKALAAQVEARARELAREEVSAQQREVGNRKFVESGRQEFSDFDERCNVVASCGATDRPEFMDIIRAMDTGPRVVMHLADNPREAQRILSLPAHEMGLALARVELQAAPKPPAPKAVSTAPKPITPVSGSGGVPDDVFSPNLSMREYAALREKQIRAREAQRR